MEIWKIVKCKKCGAIQITDAKNYFKCSKCGAWQRIIYRTFRVKAKKNVIDVGRREQIKKEFYKMIYEARA